VSQSAIADARLKAYTELLVRYNGSLNLLSAQGLRDIQRLLADGAGYARVIEDLVGPSATVVDVGSGAGIPGIVIAAKLPQASVILVERRRRRAAFLELAVGGIGLANTTVFSGDVRRLHDVCADAVTAQAVTTLSDLTGLTRHLHRDVCFLISRRGPGWREDLGAVKAVLVGGSRQPVETEPPTEAPMSAEAENSPAVTVAAEKDLDQSGSLVALRLTGGPACRSSG
jgi:16S rRNA (guanine527-N7)-methyltransferase